MKYSEIQNKQVVSVHGGAILGRVTDMEINVHDFIVDTIIVQKDSFCLASIFHWFFPKPSIVIDVSQIVRIGADVILVEDRCQK